MTGKGIRIYQKNCIEGMKKMKAESVQLTFTSPPYFNARKYSTWPTYRGYLEFIHEVFSEVFRVTEQGRICAVNCSPVIMSRKSRQHESTRLPIPFHIFGILESVGFKYLDDIIWEKPAGSAINRNANFFKNRNPVTYKPNCVTETILIFQKPAPFLIDKIVSQYKKPEPFQRKKHSFEDKVSNRPPTVQGEYEKTNIWKISPETNSKHPAPFPVGLSDRIVSYYSFEGDTVLEPFSGSGTTLVSCQKLKRKGIGFEIHKEYIDLSRERLKSLKG